MCRPCHLWAEFGPAMAGVVEFSSQVQPSVIAGLFDRAGKQIEVLVDS